MRRVGSHLDVFQTNITITLNRGLHVIGVQKALVQSVNAVCGEPMRGVTFEGFRCRCVAGKGK
jgi:hypothetical protein